MFANNAKRLIGGLVLAAAIVNPAWSATLSFTPSATNVTVGDNIDFDIVISDLGAGEQLGTFDLTVNFDASFLNFVSYDLGSSLGSLAGFEAMDLSLGNLGGGSIHLGETSFLWDLSSQASSFSLGTLRFTAGAVGSSSLGLSAVTLGDAWGENLSANLGSASVTAVAAVPEPETYAMLLAGLGLMAAVARRRRA